MFNRKVIDNEDVVRELALNSINDIVDIVERLLDKNISEQEVNTLKAHGNLFMLHCEAEMTLPDCITVYSYAIDKVKSYLPKIKDANVIDLAAFWLDKLTQAKNVLENHLQLEKEAIIKQQQLFAEVN